MAQMYNLAGMEQTECENVNPNQQLGKIPDYYRSTKKRRSLETIAKNETSSEPKIRCVDDYTVASSNWIQCSQIHKEKFQMLLDVCQRRPEDIKRINDNLVCFEHEFLVGSGSYGTAVYICLGIDGVERAIKVLPKHLYKKLLNNERKILNSYAAIESPRIVKYCNSGISGDNCYLIFNLYEQNLEEYVKKHGEDITQSRAIQMARQVFDGLDAIHGSMPRILHRDLKPSNVLVDVKGNLALSDFGIGRILSEDETTYHTSSKCGSDGWSAYESTNWVRWLSLPGDSTVEPKWKRKSDIQVAGMIAYYIYTKGKHPFGEGLIDRMKNLHEDNPVGLAELNDDADAVFKNLLSQMLARDFNKRPYVEQALKHPYFLSPGEQMKFLEAVGNEPEIKQGDPNCAVSSELDNLDPSNPRLSLLPEDWKAVIDPDDLSTFCEGGRGPSSYDGKRYTDCLRFIRNVRQHWGDRRRPPVKGMAHMGTASLDEYFLQLFPALPLVLNQIIRKHPNWKERSNLREFFPALERPMTDCED